ncbi:hypothetical protein QIT48_gp31 [Haloterrigena jeotgali icosahedral virus 1]|uniref:Uncharacterized protein n=2 Tax=root TaxID=1 RepID=A0AAF0PKZ8_9EURY|nr:hypothetical protein [Natrinema thermotolerans]YP_010772668.1 hypothetical protein QIT48_gp31 [Haloterrigena jeotgali icosahedral virus 1]QCC57403.1 hypothetical protein DVR14_01610 [Natrinema thermotolerans]WMT10393.1 hypothetical protein NP511_22790 [Natrinema thermotolerans]WPH65806.1 hypothetical protein HJIV1_gp15 [Haloterrigena jeotgali icosahedral virus 1]DAC85308.1 TPA_asm: hypothetical protein HJIV1gp30 [Haloterrigena jeotgali icosahedral virus 1]
MIDLPVDLELLALVLVAFQAGAACPAYYARERLRGFGRAIFDRLPYRSPPGLDEEQALREAADDADPGDEETTES